MDKNTLTGLILMGLLIFGFMWMNSSKQKENQQQQQQEQAEAKKAAADEPQITVDSISAAEAAAIPAAIREGGVRQGDGDSYVYNTPSVRLAMVNGEVTGSVQTADTTLDYNDVIANRLSRDITLSTRNEAVKNIREVLSDTRRYGQFASHRTGKAGTVKLGNDKLSLEISNQGGYISRATLLDYKSYLPADAKSEKIDTADVEICRPGCNKYSFELTSATQRINTADFFFTPRQESDSGVEMTLDTSGSDTLLMLPTQRKGRFVVGVGVFKKGMEKGINSSVGHGQSSGWEKTGAIDK